MDIAGIVLSVLLYNLCSQIGYTQAQCTAGWFGGLCQYKCRCTNNQCNFDGNCKSGSKCLQGWFGPACQYYNLAGLSRRWYLSPLVTDEDDTTCNQYEDLMSMRGSWSATYPFSWLRLVVNQQGVFDQITVTINNNGTETTCDDLTRVDVDSRTQDIHCPASVLMSEIKLTGLGVKSLCSLYISGGRNVAIKQKTSQSTTFSLTSPLRIWHSGLAVDGNINPGSDDSSCSKTLSTKDYKPTWYLSLSESKLVNRYTVYSTEFNLDMQGFILESYDENEQLVLQYQDSGAIKPSHMIIDRQIHQLVHSVLIYSKAHRVLTLCEVELYGDSDCPRGQYGRDCEHSCNCDVKSDSCFVSTGGCPSGCPAGFYGEGCRKACDYGRFGKACTQMCSYQCAMVACAATDGTCVDGCHDGYKPPLCKDECDTGFYGRNCSQPCPKNCNGTCERTNGTCFQGCIPRYEGALCDKALPPPTSSDTSLSIFVILGPTSAIIVLIIVAYITVFICRRRHERAADGQSFPDKFQGDAETESRSIVVESIGAATKTNTEIIDKDNPEEHVYEMT